MAYRPLLKMPTVQDGGPVQENASSSIERIVSKEVLDGQLIEGITIRGGSVENKIPHRLNRRAKGFFVVSKNSAGDVWGVSTRAGISVYTSSSSSLILSLWVF